MRYLFIFCTLAGFLFSGCGSKLDRAKKAYEKGQYYKAEQMLEALMLLEPTETVQNLLYLSKAAFKFITADSLLKNGSLAAAWKSFDQGGKYDTTSPVFKAIGEKLANATIQEIETKYIPGKKWDEAIDQAAALLKYRLHPGEANQCLAEAGYGKEKKYSLNVIGAWQEVLKLDPENKKAQEALAGVEKARQPIADAFGKYQMAMVKKDFNSWKGFVNKECMGAIEDNIRNSLKAGEKNIKNVRDFFDQAVAQDPINEKSATGATMIAFEEIKPGLVQVYYTYPSWPRCNRVDTEIKGGAVKFGCETGSDMPNPLKK